MPDKEQSTYRYRILRYTPNLIRDEWVNVGVVIEQADGSRWAARFIEEQAEIARVRRLHPAANEELLRSLSAEFEFRLGAPGADIAAVLAKLDQSLSNVLQFSPRRGVLAGEGLEAELDRLYREHVAVPPRLHGGFAESTRAWIKKRLDYIFSRRRVPKLQRGIRVAEYTYPGDPLRLDYGYRNGAPGFLHALALGRDPAQAKVLAYTAGAIRKRVADAEFTAITEVEPSPENPRHQFMAGLLREQRISIVPLSGIDKFAEELRLKLSA
ncbi:MAG TPA: DUF3037 domain-containing protein [Candidatus Acidoferrales bacterium]|nr:DUF3037 domain-containing protein [Candidatus Acidoferrales bacterium]